jgi:protein-S-isoprenylcysteine O-methyltransferase Ste14
MRREIRKWILQSVAGLVAYTLLLFLVAGRWDWGWGWALLGVIAGFMAAHPLLLVPIDPALLVEREQGLRAEGVKRWDRIVTALGAGLMPLASWVVAALDLRFGWTGTIPLVLHVLGLAVNMLGYGLFLWAMISNAYFAEGVRIQEERGHRVVTKGPYRYVRHPGYVGAILAQLSTPFLLGSWWAMAASVASASLYVLRTALEDGTLQAELDGYAEYARQTRFRLLPGLW